MIPSEGDGIEDRSANRLITATDFFWTGEMTEKYTVSPSDAVKKKCGFRTRKHARVRDQSSSVKTCCHAGLTINPGGFMGHGIRKITQVEGWKLCK